MLIRSLRHRAPMLWLLLPMMGGLVLGRVVPAPVSTVLLVLGAAACLIAALACTAQPVTWALLICMANTAMGWVYYELRRTRLPAWEELPPRQAELCVRVQRLFAPPEDGKRVSGIAQVVDTPKQLSELRGQRLYFSCRRTLEDRTPVRSEVLRVRGVLEPLPRSAPVDTFEGFLVNGGLNFRLTRGEILRAEQPASPYRLFCHRLRKQLGAILAQGLEQHPERVAVLQGMVLGEAAGLTAAQEKAFLQSGTMHLFSISGLHIAAIAVALHMCASLARMPVWIRSAFTVAALWLYVDVTGTVPSAVRAFVMVALVEGALLLRRPINALATLALAAWVALVVDPMQLFGASFQMSYGIVAGLLLLGLPLGETLQAATRPFTWLPSAAWTWRHRTVEWLHRTASGTVAIGLATFLVSTVATLLYFQIFTPGALVGNLLFIPISSFALWAGFLSLGCGLLGAGWLSSVFNHAAALILWIMDEAIALCVTLPASHVEGRFQSPMVGFVALSGLMILLLFGYSTRWGLHKGLWCVPFAWTAAFLVFGVTW